MRIAIVIVGYKRLEGIKRLIQSLEQAYYDETVDLIFDIDKSDIDSVIGFANDYQWNYGKKIVRTYDTRLGLRKHMMKIGELFETENYDALIILEDDLIVSPAYYSYAKQSIEKYSSEPKVFGISLYSRTTTWSSNIFLPVKNEYDNYFMQVAETWGQVWLKDNWNLFAKWYEKHTNNISGRVDLPIEIASFPETAYSRYLTTFLIETDKYFSVPYIGYSSCFADAGEHTSLSGFNEHTMIQIGNYRNTNLADMNEESIRYDVYDNLMNISQWLDINSDELTVELSDYKRQKINRYLLSDRIYDYKVIKSFGYALRPVELNILYNTKGTDIFLYDTKVQEKNNYKRNEYRNILYKMGAHAENSRIVIRLFIGVIKRKLGIKNE